MFIYNTIIVRSERGVSTTVEPNDILLFNRLATQPTTGARRPFVGRHTHAWVSVSLEFYVRSQRQYRSLKNNLTHNIVYIRSGRYASASSLVQVVKVTSCRRGRPPAWVCTPCRPPSAVRAPSIFSPIRSRRFRWRFPNRWPLRHLSKAKKKKTQRKQLIQHSNDGSRSVARSFGTPVEKTELSRVVRIQNRIGSTEKRCTKFYPKVIYARECGAKLTNNSKIQCSFIGQV